MCVDVDKYHKLICQTGDPVILLNIASNTQQLVKVLDLGFGKVKQERRAESAAYETEGTWYEKRKKKKNIFCI